MARYFNEVMKFNKRETIDILEYDNETDRDIDHEALVNMYYDNTTPEQRDIDEEEGLSVWKAVKMAFTNPDPFELVNYDRCVPFTSNYRLFYTTCKCGCNSYEVVNSGDDKWIASSTSHPAVISYPKLKGMRSII